MAKRKGKDFCTDGTMTFTNLGDIRGCTIVVKVDEVISVQDAKAIQRELKKAMPEAAQIVITCHHLKKNSANLDADDWNHGIIYD